ncbi:MAG: hypothetical protein GTO14_25500 [Anaerolineales bacterium]|nr:hypothetical protein [Anaerolineales bacterium]
MKINKTLATVIITVTVLAILAAAGLAIYRLGYAHGLTASAGDFMHGCFFRDFWGRFPHRGILGMRQPFFGFSLLRVVPGFLLFVGVVALVVLAVNSLLRAAGTSGPPDGESKKSST